MTAKQTRDRDTPRTRARYNRIAPLYDRLEAGLERRYYAQWRAQLWAAVRGPQVLEIGAGTGKNIAYYPQDVQITAIDLASHMLAYARERRTPTRAAINFAVMDAEHLAFPDETFNSVVATFVFGSVPDPVRGLHEVRRVTKPGGQILLLEFVRPNGLLGCVIDLVNPLFQQVYGANINRHTIDDLRRASLQIESVAGYWGGFVQVVTADPHRSHH